MTHILKVVPLIAALSGAVEVAHAEVPVPRLAPSPSSVTAASLSSAATSLPIEAQIKREATVDVSRAVSEFYEERGYRPFWTADRADAFRSRMALAAHDGFDPDDYAVPFAGPSGLTSAAEEVSLTEAALRYARHATSGRLRPRSVSPIMTIDPPKLDERRFLRRLARTSDIPRLLDRLHPRHVQFLALREKLVEALGATRDQRTPIGKGRNLRRGVKEHRVAILRSRIGATVRRGEDPTIFDDGLDVAVRTYQSSKGLRADGIVGPRTLALLDEGIGDNPVASLISNMERWRWLPRSLGAHHVMVNVPAYRVRVISDETVAYDGRVIVGAVGHPTPIFSDEIEHIVVNPYWNVPVSIASKEMLGGIVKNPRGYFGRRGYEAVYNGRVVDPGSLSWHKGMLHKVRIRQRPGRRNALGAVKFMFPNRHAVYLHDTPTKHLFKRSRRAYSHGCVRVDKPFEFADALLRTHPDLSGPRIRRLVGGRERTVRLDSHIPVHLTYFTREVAPDGTLKRYSDVYGYDRRTQRALGL